MFQNAVIPKVQDYRLLDYDFNDLALDDDDTLKASIRMFIDLDLVDKFRINYEVSARFTCFHINLSYIINDYLIYLVTLVRV